MTIYLYNRYGKVFLQDGMKHVNDPRALRKQENRFKTKNTKKKK